MRAACWIELESTHFIFNPSTFIPEGWVHLKRLLIEQEIAKLIGAIEHGFYQPSMKDHLQTLENRKAVLAADLKKAKEPPPLLHPNMAQEPRKRVDTFFRAIEDEDMRLKAGENI